MTGGPALRSQHMLSGRALRAWGPWFIALLAMVIGIALIVTTPPERVPVGFRAEDVFSYLLLPISSATVGAVVAWRRPHNAVGWLLATAGWISSWQYLTAGYAVHGLFGEVRLPMAEVSAWAYSWSGMWIGPVLGNLFVRFPDGRSADIGGRFSGRLVIAAAAFASVAVGFREGPLLFFREVANPFGVAGADGALNTAFGAAGLLYVVAAVPAIGALLRRSRRAHGVERQQFKWFMVGVLLALAVVAVGGALFFVGPNFAKFVISNGVAAIPIAVGVAILRHRLYDIDLLINRTVVYGATSLALAATFFAGIVGLQALLRPVTSGSELAVAASTLVSFALFQPVRRRVQDEVNRRFDRSRYDAARTLDAFADQLRDEVDLDALRDDLLGAVRQTMAPAHTSLWLRKPSR
jgi:hypothetical protein